MKICCLNGQCLSIFSKFGPKFLMIYEKIDSVNKNTHIFRVKRLLRQVVRRPRGRLTPTSGASYPMNEHIL